MKQDKFRKGQIWLFSGDEIHMIIDHEDCSMVSTRNVCLISMKRFWYELGGIRGEEEMKNTFGKAKLLGNSLGDFYKNIPALLLDPDPKVRDTIEYFINCKGNK